MKKIAVVAIEATPPHSHAGFSFLCFLIWHMTGIAVVIPVSSSCHLSKKKKKKLKVDPMHLKFTFPVVTGVCETGKRSLVVG